jgi:hypothetical protein
MKFVCLCYGVLVTVRLCPPVQDFYDCFTKHQQANRKCSGLNEFRVDVRRFRSISFVRIMK